MPLFVAPSPKRNESFVGRRGAGLDPIDTVTRGASIKETSQAFTIQCCKTVRACCSQSFIADGQSIHTFSKVADLRTQGRAPKVERRMPSKRAAKLYRQRASSGEPRIKPRKAQVPKRDWRVDNQKAVERFAKIAKEAAIEAAPRERYSIVPQIAKLHAPPAAIAGVAPMQIATLTTEGNVQAQVAAQAVEPSTD